MRAVARRLPASARARRWARARASSACERIFIAASERATATLGAALARAAMRGDVICLRGPVGAGKSALARAFVRARLGDGTADVPSPTYLVQQRYETEAGEVHHYDLYRLRSEDEVRSMCDLGESGRGAISVVEWSERLGGLTPAARLEVHVSTTREGEEGGGEMISCDESEEDAEDGAGEVGEEEEEVDAAYVDVARRTFRLVGYGASWATRVKDLRL